VVDEENVASRRVAAAVGAREDERWRTPAGRLMVRHVCAIDRVSASPGAPGAV
jgi:hypothetical protein